MERPTTPEDFDDLTAPEPEQCPDEAYDEMRQRKVDDGIDWNEPSVEECFEKLVADELVDTLGDIFSPGFMRKEQAGDDLKYTECPECNEIALLWEGNEATCENCGHYEQMVRDERN